MKRMGHFKQKPELSGQADVTQKKPGGRRLEVPLHWFLILHISIVINSLSGAASKMAGKQDFLSFRFFFYYGLVLLATFLFALIWQQVLKHMSLTFAFTNKPINMVWSLVWGIVIFHEKLTWKMALGSAIILAGIMIGVSGNERNK